PPSGIALGPQGTLAYTDQVQIGIIRVFPGELNINQRYIQSLYQDLVGPADFSVGLDIAQQLLVTNGAQALVRGIAQSAIAQTSFVQHLYRELLVRATAPLEEQCIVAALAGGA